MSNFYASTFNGYTPYYTNSQNTGQSNNALSTASGAGCSPYSSAFLASYGYAQQNQPQQRTLAEKLSSAGTIPSVYNAFLQPYGQVSPSATPGSHGAVGSPIPKHNPNFVNAPKPPTPSFGTGATYDALVFNTAAQMLQQRNANATIGSLNPRWPVSVKGRYPKRHSKGFGGNKDSQQFYCEVCKITCAGQQTYKEHLDGQKHKKKEALLKGENNISLPRNKVSFRCDLCNVTCTGKDTYEAHIRGSKHQKTVALVKKRGGELPSNEPTIIPPTEYQERLGFVIPPPLPPAVSNPKSPAPPPPPIQPSKRIVGISTVNFVPSSKLNCTQLLENKKNEALTALASAGQNPTDKAINAQSEEIRAMIAAEQSVAPVGEDYIEAENDAHGKLIQYCCKLCDCKFSDPNAKEIHLKGRRHRLQYKLKVDPSLQVEMKVPANRRIGGRYGGSAKSTPMLMNSIPTWYTPSPFGHSPHTLSHAHDIRKAGSVDDRHIAAKYHELCPDNEFMSRLFHILSNIENTLKKVSDYIHENSIEQEAERNNKERLLQGVQRAGLLADRLLLKGDTEVELVVLCAEIPTKSLLQEVAEQFRLKYSTSFDFDKALIVDVCDPSIIIGYEGSPLKISASLTSCCYRDCGEAPLPTDSLNKELCLEALAKLRRGKWFQAKCSPLPTCIETLHIFLDLRKRRDSWKSLSVWMCELLVEHIFDSTHDLLNTGDAFRRVIEAVASGFLSPLGPGLADPCEKEHPNVLTALSLQEREDLMFDAQQCLQMIGFNQIYKVLDTQRLPDVRPPLDRKRPYDEKNGVTNEVKKEKMDGDNEGNFNESSSNN